MGRWAADYLTGALSDRPLDGSGKEGARWDTATRGTTVQRSVRGEA
jgi:hypothetical protein